MKPIAPALRAFSVVSAPSCISELNMRIGHGCALMICWTAEMPSMFGILTSMVMHPV